MGRCLLGAYRQARMWQSLLVLPLIYCFLAYTTDVYSAPSRNNYYVDQNSIALQEMRDSIESMRHEVRNNEAEIRMFDEKLKNLDTIIENVRDQLSESSKSHKEQLKGNSSTLEGKITSLETVSKGLVADLKQFKSHANDSSTALAAYKQKISDLEKIVEQQNQNIDHLQAAMRSLLDALNVKDISTPSSKVPTSEKSVTDSGNTYRIKNGDSLEKIARAHQTTVQALKEVNGLTNDKIVVGKVLQIPEK